MNVSRYQIVTNVSVGILATCVASCGSSSVTLVEKPGSSVVQSNFSAESRISASTGEVRRFIAKRLLEDFRISSDFLGIKKIQNAKIIGPYPDDGLFGSKDTDVYCVSFSIKNSNALVVDQDIILNAYMRQHGDVLSSKFRFLKAYNTKCAPAAVPFRELEESSSSSGLPS